MTTLGLSAAGASPGTLSDHTTGKARAIKTPSYLDILKTTAVIGGSSVVNIGFGIVRNKAMASYLGPAGIGLMALHSSVADLTLSLAGMGIHSSGVRQIAEAVGSGEAERIARTVTVLKRVSILLGLCGAGSLVLLCGPISRFTFGSDQQAVGVALLSAAVFFRLVSAGQCALIQGMRRIADLASMSVLAGLLGTVITVPLVYYFREGGVVPSLVAGAAASVLCSWWYSQKVQIPTPSLAAAQIGREAASLLKLGVAFMASAFLTMGAAYAIRIIILRSAGFEAAGLYHAAWALGGLYVGFILQAMGADFYPRLTAVCTDNRQCNRLVNEQARISLLLAGPGVIATLTLAPLVLGAFYSAEFQAAVSLLRWICLGMMLRVVAWPMGFIVLAKGAQQIFLWTEIAATLVHVGLAWLLVTRLGVDGSGMAFLALYVWHSLVIYAVVRRLSGFRWSAENLKLGLMFLPSTGLLFCSFYLLPSWLSVATGLAMSLLTGLYSARTILTLVPLESTPRLIRSWFPRLCVAAPETGSPARPLG
jgi:enterobacterial common antigen flippase